MRKWKNRQEVKKAHERFTIDLFLEWFNRWHSSQFKVIDEPDPPEAIIKSGKTIRWVEVTAAFWNDAFAQDICSYATEGEGHKPAPDGAVSVNPTSVFVRKFITLLAQKLSKSSYVDYRDTYGPGYLIVSIQYPFFSKDVVARLGCAWDELQVVDRGCFRSIYFAYREFGGGYRIMRWAHYSVSRRRGLREEVVIDLARRKRSL
jgi:hypothetical protein